MLTRSGLDRRRDDLLRVCDRSGTAEQLFADVTRQLRSVVPFTGSACFGLDPVTMLATAPAWIENLDPSQCAAFWPREFLVEDTNLFLAMARSGTAAAGLVRATGERPARSARYREFLAPQGYGDELRALLRADGSVWGSVSLYRSEGEPPFSADEIGFVGSLSRPLAEALRSRLAARATTSDDALPGPGVLVFQRSGALLNTNDEARAWLRQLPGAARLPGGVPLPVRVLLAHALAVAEGRQGGEPRMRLRTSNGRWLVLHASHLPGAGTATDLLAVVVEPAASSEVAPIIVEAYALTGRERDIISALARGLTTAEMAQQLFLSPHTVRDHVKSIFAKVGVSTRGELVAKLFADHYASGLQPHR